MKGRKEGRLWRSIDGCCDQWVEKKIEKER